MIKPTDRDPRVNNRYAVPHPLVRARVGKTAHAYVTMNNLGDKLTHVDFSCVLFIFHYNWGTRLSSTWSLDSILCQD